MDSDRERVCDTALSLCVWSFIAGNYDTQTKQKHTDKTQKRSRKNTVSIKQETTSVNESNKEEHK